jgi:hypothetical protein
MNGDQPFDDERVLSISCDECAMQCTAACADCVVTFVLREEQSLELDGEEARVVQLFGAAGMVPSLKFHVAS